MWCPSCGAEYRPGFTHCPDCDVDLIASPPPEPEAAPARRVTGPGLGSGLGDDPVEVHVGAPVEVDVMASVLQGSGISCEVWRSGMQEAMPGVGGLFPARLVVAAADAERASALVALARSGALDLSTEEDEPDEDEAETPAAAEGPVSEVGPWWRRGRSPH